MKRTIAGITAIIAVVVLQVQAVANDEQIAKSIAERLQKQQQTAKLADFNIGVQVDKGTVTMMGQVADANQAITALEIARRVPGVKLVVNDLYVTQGTAAAPQIQAVQQANATAAYAPLPQPVPQPIIGAGVATQPLNVQQFQPQHIPATSAQMSGQLHTAQRVFAAPNPVVAPQQIQPRAPQPIAVQRPAQATARPVQYAPANQAPVAFARSQAVQNRRVPVQTIAQADYSYPSGGISGGPVAQGGGGGASFDQPQLPGYAWPSYAASPNYGAVTYPQQYSPTAWPYIGPFYPYPQVPLGWRKVTLEWDDGWWFLDFKSK